jgi:hypothetical protein
MAGRTRLARVKIEHVALWHRGELVWLDLDTVPENVVLPLKWLLASAAAPALLLRTNGCDEVPSK